MSYPKEIRKNIKAYGECPSLKHLWRPLWKCPASATPVVVATSWLLIFYIEYFFYCLFQLPYPTDTKHVFGRAVKPTDKAAWGLYITQLRCAVATPAPGTAQKQLILHQFYSPVRHVLWQCSSQTIAINHLFLLIHILVLLQGWSEK